MNISGIRSYMTTAQAGQIRTGRVNDPTTVSTDLASQAAGSSSSAAKERPEEAPVREQSFGAYDFARQYDPNARYDLKGADSDIRSLDVEKAISRVQKNAVMGEYQIFQPAAGDKDPSRLADLHPAEDFSF